MFIKWFSIIVLCVSVNSLKLKQVVMLSRHSIRTPLVSNLEAYSEKKWPVWDEESGYLTKKGRQLERFMGRYVSEWMMNEKLFQDKCPDEDEVYVYSNTKQRTIETANAFVDGAFGDCVTVHYNKDTTEMDPIFNPIIRNDTQDFKDLVISEMKKKLDAISLPRPYRELDRILELKNSSICRKENICTLSKVKHDIVFNLNEEPDVSGPLMIANFIVDAFLMAYYDGKPIHEVAWGEVTLLTEWDTLLSAVRAYHDVRFKTKVLSRDLASPLLEYMTDIFLNGDKKVYLLVGHDANINSLTSAMNFKDYSLHDQAEKTPIAGKLVFQKWYDEYKDRELLRVYYLYPSLQQIRDGVQLTLDNPPQWALLEMENCKLDVHGLCPWEDFVKLLKTL
ncbi:glucose-1-phosphatase-like [Choristoneura fumiferana]|uniref:glucose-1-phosphatase-like n=1 Tax=Choristoneura fumiferana TaxID=7141 RepID=UPI003D154EEC